MDAQLLRSLLQEEGREKSPFHLVSRYQRCLHRDQTPTLLGPTLPQRPQGLEPLLGCFCEPPLLWAVLFLLGSLYFLPNFLFCHGV